MSGKLGAEQNNVDTSDVLACNKATGQTSIGKLVLNQFRVMIIAVNAGGYRPVRNVM
jgi:hypothetical protein